MQEILLQNIEVLFQKNGLELRGADVRIIGHQIAEIGQGLKPSPQAKVINCTNKTVLPGLINTHHHFFQILTRCLPGGQDKKLFDWLNYHYQVWKFVEPEMIYAASRLAMAELMLTGCTTSSDHLYIYPGNLQTDDPALLQVKAAQELGMRFCMTRGSMSVGKSAGGLPPDSLTETDERILLHSEHCVQKFHDAAEFSMCQVHLAPCSPFNVSKQLMRESASLARKHKVRLHTHLAETLDEEKYCKEKFNRTPLELMRELEWLGPDVWFAHGIYFSDHDLEILAQTQTAVSHCPSSNMRLSSGVCRVPEMMKLGIPVGLAVDGSASNDSSDMLGELRQAMLLGRLKYGSDALTARQVIELATQGSAKVLARKELGTLEVGKAADLAIFDMNQLQYAGACDLIAALVFTGFNHRAWAVMINGKFTVMEGNLVMQSEEEITKEGKKQAKKLWEKAAVI